MIFRKYRLNDGGIYWHRLYFGLVPRWMTRYSPPGGFYNYAAYAYKPHEYVRDVWLQAKWFVQRGRRGYSDQDVWSICDYLCEWMPKALETLRRNKHGHPIGVSKKSWDAKVKRMINAFKTARNINNYDYKTTAEIQAALRQFRKDFNLVKTHFFSLWD